MTQEQKKAQDIMLEAERLQKEDEATGPADVLEAYIVCAIAKALVEARNCCQHSFGCKQRPKPVCIKCGGTADYHECNPTTV